MIYKPGPERETANEATIRRPLSRASPVGGLARLGGRRPGMAGRKYTVLWTKQKTKKNKNSVFFWWERNEELNSVVVGERV